ncbi:MAG TPA: right-handed parallel beta-helix repeat-containing protein, partial [Polyangiaceae bacterium]
MPARSFALGATGLARASFLLGVLCAAEARAGTLEVGPGKTYAAPCGAFAMAMDGDTIEIDAAGNYDGDVCAITRSGLTIVGVNGRAHIDAAGQNAQGKAIWVVQGKDTTIQNIELSGATVPDKNGAGIRQEGTNLTVLNCYFHDNEDGILAGADASSTIRIDSSEFARNGFGDGFSHNMYIGAVGMFILEYSYSHSAKVGHLVKSRALENHILYNRLTGEADGTESYEINLPDAGTSYIIGNLIQQGPGTENSVMLDYASESTANPGQALYVASNTFVNERGGDALFVSVGAGITTAAVVKNNLFMGPGNATNQASPVQAGNLSTNDALLVDVANFDYHLLPGSPCEDAGVDPGTSADAVSLVPVKQYVHPLAFETRTSVGVIDIGAYELGGGTPAGGSAGSSGTGATGAGVAGRGIAGVSGNGGASGSGGVSAPAGSSDGGGCGCSLPKRHGSRQALSLCVGLGLWLA